MAVFWYILISVLAVSLISFIGVFFLALKKEILDKLLDLFISFACGSLLGGAFFHLLPESMDKLGNSTFVWVAIAFLMFFVLEKFFLWRHCHQQHCDVHAFSYLNLIGDGIHNFIDGTVIAAAFLTNLALGFSTTLAVIFHEIPQEIGDFSILIYGGWSRKKALIFNFLSALPAVVGALIIYFFSHQFLGYVAFLLPFAAGGFLYIAATDLIPQLHKKNTISKSILQFIALTSGLVLMWLL